MASLYFKYAAMNSGKSTQLLQAQYNYFERGMNPVAMTAQIDDRAGAGKIASRLGLYHPADVFDENTDICAYVEDLHKDKPVDIVFIDEAQFLTEAQVEQCARLVDDFDIPVICYGLKTDFRGKLFPGSEALLRLADNIEEIKAICWCGKKATMTARITPKGEVMREGQQVAIGGNEMYTALCRKHFMSGEAKAMPATQSDDKKSAA
ncbi:MAG: thymidine kinase [Alphaproteobacteria bacterium]|nr:thymidine kinase [Alphaproteobacteria bacterium]